METVVKKYDCSKNMSEQVRRRFLFVLNNRDYTPLKFAEKKELNPYLVKRLAAGEKLFDKGDLKMIADALELSQDYFLVEIDNPAEEELKLTIYQKFYGLTSENQKEMSGMMKEIFDIIF